MPEGEQRITDIQDSASRAMLLIAWPGQDMSDIHRVRRMGQLSRALSVRLRQELRSAMGEAYSPHAGHFGSDVWKGHGYLQALVSVSPDKADAARDAVLAAAKGLLNEGINDELFQEVHTPALTNLPQWRANNAYWLNQVSARATSSPYRLEWSQTMMSDIAAITAEELSALAKETFAREPLVVIGISP
jgi:predicted Zn-dependent peptidase